MLYSSKGATECLNSYSDLCSDHQLAYAGCKCSTALLTLRGKTKRPKVEAKQKVPQISLIGGTKKLR